MKISIVVPAYNEQSRIEEFLQSVVKLKLPVIVVNDGSKDTTADLSKKYPVTVISHKVNLGKGAALITGCEAAFSSGADAVIMMDADGQHHVEDLKHFIAALEEDKVDVVFGSRNLSLGVPLVRYLGNKFASVFINIMFGIYISDLLCGYRAFTKKAYKSLKWQSRGYGVETEMVVRTGKYHLHYCEVPVETIYYDKFKGVTIIDAFDILISVIKWKLRL